MSLLTEQECEALCKAAAAAHPDGVTEEQAQAVLDWAGMLRAEVALLDNVLRGNMSVRIDEKGEPVFAFTRKGTSAAKKLLARESGKATR